MAKLATFLRSRQKGWELDRYEFSPWWHKYSMFLNSFLPNLQGEKYSFAEVTLHAWYLSEEISPIDVAFAKFL